MTQTSLLAQAGAHAALAQQWRVRYATCVDEKEALVTEVALLRTGAAASEIPRERHV